jgi:MFS-type transporter involved in bile tolerance (Atg22 family)
VSYDAISWGNSVGPVLGLLAVVAVLPGVLAGKGLSQRWVFGAVCVTGVVLWLLGAVIFIVQYQILGTDVMGDFATWPVRTAGVYLRRSLWFALFWGPVLAFVWLVLAQGVERRRGLAMREGPDA